MPDRTDTGRRRWAATTGLATVALLLVATGLSPATTGPLALIAIFLPHAWLGLVVGCAVVQVRRRSRTVGLLLAVTVAVGLVRFGADWLSLDSSDSVGDGHVVRLVSWNLEADSRPPMEYISPLLEQDADIVALQELTPEAAAMIDSAPAVTRRWPYRSLMPEATVWGMGILSRFPLGQVTLSDDPVMQVVAVQLGKSATVWLVNAHPQRSPIQRYEPLGIPVGVETAERDERLVRVRAAIDAIVQQGGSVVAIGDFNVAPTEAGYRSLVAGLRDLHTEVGIGLGWTWRPDPVEWTRAGLLRIDYALVDPSVTPMAMTVACGYIGDHCLLSATVRMPVR